MEVDLREATTLINTTFEDMGTAHNDLVKGLEKDAKATNDRMDRIREDTNNDRRALRSVQRKVLSGSWILNRILFYFNPL